MGSGKAVRRSPGRRCCRQHCLGVLRVQRRLGELRKEPEMGAGEMECGDRLDFMFLTVRSNKDVYRAGREWRQKVLGLKDNPRSSLWTLISRGQR